MSGPDDLDQDDAQRIASGELREAALGNVPNPPKDLYPHAGVVTDSDTRDLLDMAVDVMGQTRTQETEWYTEIVRSHATDRAREAVSRGNTPEMEFLTGWQNYEPDVSGLHTMERMESWLLDRERAKMVYLAGHQGNGKTDLAHLCLEIVKRRSEKRTDLKEAELASNIPSSRATDTITDYQDLKQWFTAGSADDNKWYVFDEASSELSGYQSDREKVEKYLSELIKKMRKNGCNLIIIGHTGMDVHPDIRRLADYVHKTGTKTAAVYATVKRGEGAGLRFQLRGIPETGLKYDTEDEATFTWGDLEDGEEEVDPLDTEQFREWRNQRIAELYAPDSDDGLSSSELAAAYDISPRTVRRAVS